MSAERRPAARVSPPDDPPRSWTASGQATRAATGRPPVGDALLCDPRRAWVVEEGEVELYVVQLEGSGAVAWESIGHVERGGLLVGVAVADCAGLVARVPIGARLQGLWLDRPPSGEEQPIADAVDDWLDHTLRKLGSLLAGRKVHPLARAGRDGSSLGLAVAQLSIGVDAQLLRDMQIALAPAGHSWVNVRAGAVRLLGPARSQSLATGELAPMGDADWLVAERGAAVTIHSTAEVVRAGMVAEGLGGLSEDLLEVTVRRLERAEDAERERQERRSARDDATIDTVVRDLRTVLDQRVSELGRLAEAPAYSAVRIVGAHLGASVRSPAQSAEHGPRVDAISKIAHASQLRTRRVELAGRWWRRDYGPLVGVLREGDVPVALTPTRFGYKLHDPLTGEPRRVDAEQAARLSTEARELYPPMPAVPLGARDVVRFAARGSRGEVTTMILCAIAVALLGLMVPVLTGVVLGQLVPEAEGRRIAELCALLLVSALVSAGLTVVFNLSSLRLEGRLDYRIQAGVWDRMLGLHANFFRDYSTGQLATAVLGVSETREALTGVTFQAAMAVVVVVCDLALIAVLDLRLLLAALVMLGVSLAALAFAGRRQLPHQSGAYELEKEVNSRTYQLISGVAKISTAGAEARAFTHWAVVFARMRRGAFAARAVENRLAAFNAAFTLFGAIVAFFVVGALLHVSLSRFLIFNVAYFQVLASVLQISAAAVLTLEMVPSLQSLAPLLEAVPESVVALEDSGRLRGSVTLERVSFGYREGVRALDEVSFSISAGEFVGIVGPSGGGKSTLIRLLLGFESPWSGSIRYDGQDLGDLDPTSVRSQCGVVLQDTQLFAGDILTNIIGTGLYTYDDAWEAVKSCGLEETVSEMPMGMYTMLSDAGAGLSGGQRQRLLLARALVTRPSIVILDEATSALDNRTQAQVMDSMRRLKATRIVVAHRLTTIRGADRIIVIDSGRVVQQGGFDQLVNEEGVFRDLAQRQL